MIYTMDNLVQKLTQFFDNTQRPIALHEPYIKGNEGAYIQECLETGWVSSIGKYVDRFEKDLSQYTDLHAVAVINGTAALHLCLICAGIAPGDEVFVPDLTFVATANAVSYCHATPHFVEVEKDTFGVDPDKLEKYLKTLPNIPKAMLVTHIFGHPAQIIELKSICEKYGIILIEDSSESLGSFVGGKHTGNFGQMATLSFNGNKTITTGGGGAVLTNSIELATRIKHLSTTAKVAHPYNHVHDKVGYNYRMPNINAALGCAQLEKLPEFLESKRRIANAYRKLFAQFPDIKFIDEPPKASSNFWLNTITLASEKDRNYLLDSLGGHQIQCRGLWAPMSTLPMYKNCPRMVTNVAYDLCARSINLPSSVAVAELVEE